jgi:copper(I)-binding protein
MRGLVAVVCAAVAIACAGESHAIVIEEAWGRPAGEGANGVAYFTISNPDSVPMHLDSVRTTAARLAELHETVLTGGIARMTPLTGLDIPAGGRVQMEPGGAHVMLVELTAPASIGDSLAIQLYFANGTSVSSFVKVRAP